MTDFSITTRTMPREPDQPDLNTQGGRLRWARRRFSLGSLEETAKKIGVNKHTLKSHERGERRGEGFSKAQAEHYARKFGVDKNWLMFGGDNPLGDLSPEEQARARRLLEAARD